MFLHLRNGRWSLCLENHWVGRKLVRDQLRKDWMSRAMKARLMMSLEFRCDWKPLRILK